MKNYRFKEIPGRIGSLAFSIFILAGCLSSCGGGGKDGDKQFPDNFMSMGDNARVAYMIDKVAPDSVARFICEAALGHVRGAKIDTLANATLYAYESYKDSDLMVFSEAFDVYSNSLPLPDKMKILSMTGLSDPQGLGYELGLEYVGNIREKKMSVDQVEKEIEAFRVACGTDTVMFTRFVKGFQTVLRVDHGKDLPEAFYTKFIDYK